MINNKKAYEDRLLVNPVQYTPENRRMFDRLKDLIKRKGKKKAILQAKDAEHLIHTYFLFHVPLDVRYLRYIAHRFFYFNLWRLFMKNNDDLMAG